MSSRIDDDDCKSKKNRVSKWQTLNDCYEEKAKFLENENKKIKERIANLTQRQNDLATIHGGSSVSNDDILTLNVGGELMKVKRGTLIQIKGSTLAALFSGRWEDRLLLDEDGHVFLDVNPDCFKTILLYLQELKLSPSGHTPKLTCVTKENEVFLDSLLQSLGLSESNHNRLDSTIMAGLDSACMRSLFSFLEEDGIQGKLNLLYRGSRDGSLVNNFHSKCDNKGATITLIKDTGGFVFGGFADTSWTSPPPYTFKSAPKAFLFTLKCHSGLAPTKMKQKKVNDPRAVYHSRDCGPVFGNIDILCSDKNVTSSRTNIGQAYECPGGQEGHTFLTGSQDFTKEEMEVFSFDDTCIRNNLNPNPTRKIEETELYNIEFSKLPEELKVVLEEEKKELMTTWEEVTASEEKFEQENKYLDYFLSTKEADDTIVHFNVGIHNKRMSVKCSTLGHLPQSVLAKQFDNDLWVFQKNQQSKINDNNTSDDVNHQKKNNAMFIDYSEYCFEKVLDQLRLLSMHRNQDESVPPLPDIQEEYRIKFKILVEYYFPHGSDSQHFFREDN